MLELLKFLCDKDNYTTYRQYVPKAQDGVINKLVSLLDELVTSLDRTVSYEEYRVYVVTQWPNLTKKDKDELEIATAYLDKAGQSDIGEDAARLLLDNLRARTSAFKLAEAYLDYSEGRTTQEQLQSVVDASDLVSKDSFNVEYVTDDLEELYNSCVAKQGLRWRLNCLNQSLGSLRKGDFGFIFARPET